MSTKNLRLMSLKHYIVTFFTPSVSELTALPRWLQLVKTTNSFLLHVM
jgi:hypothetical protein